MVWAFFYIIILVLSCSITLCIRRYALKTNLLDVPNHRSSHTVATPRGGGLSFVIAFVTALFVLAYFKTVSIVMLVVLVGCGSIVALLGFLDDLYTLPAKWRLLGHIAMCALAVFLLGGMPAITIFSWILPTGIISTILAIFYLAWLLNLYNFMDGIDGIAALEALTVCVSSALIYYLNNYGIAFFMPLSLAAAVGGFLIFNFPPARIFMGDAGSGFLGFVLGVLSIQAALLNPSFFWSWLILLGVFIVDSTLTLLTRAYRRERVWDAHCSHAYQQASRLYKTHRGVTLTVLFINLLWLFPWAFLVSNNTIPGIVGFFISYTPLVALAVKFNAGNLKVS